MTNFASVPQTRKIHHFILLIVFVPSSACQYLLDSVVIIHIPLMHNLRLARFNNMLPSQQLSSFSSSIVKAMKGIIYPS